MTSCFRKLATKKTQKHTTQFVGEGLEFMSNQDLRNLFCCVNRSEISVTVSGKCFYFDAIDAVG